MLHHSKSLSPVAVALLLAGSPLSGCGEDAGNGGIGEGAADPRVATPLPEPPAFDPSKIEFNPASTGVAGIYPLKGVAGATSAGATLTLTNLVTGATATATANADGSFEAGIEAQDGDWLRVEAQTAGGRAPHATLLLGDAVSLIELDPCVELSPDGFGNSGPVVVTSACDSESTVQPLVLHPDTLSVDVAPAIPATGLALSSGEILTIDFTATEPAVIVIPIELDGRVLPYSVVIEP